MDHSTLIATIKSKLTSVSDLVTKRLVLELIQYVVKLEKLPSPVPPKPSTKGEKNAKYYRENIDLAHLPSTGNAKEEEQLPKLVKRLLDYAEKLEKDKKK